MKTTKENKAGTELACRIKKLVDTLTGSYRVILDATPFQLLTPGCQDARLVTIEPQKLFDMAKELDPRMQKDEAQAKAIYEAIHKAIPEGFEDDLWDLILSQQSDSFRLGCFCGVLMGALTEGASKERIDQLAKGLFVWIIADRGLEGFDPKPGLKAA